MSKKQANTYTPHATIADLEEFYRPLDDAEKPKAQRLLEYASLKIDVRFKEYGKELPTDEPGLILLKDITCAMVTRALKDEGVGNFSNVSTTVGEFSESWSPANPDGAIYLKDDELRDLGLCGGQFMSVEVGFCDE